MRLEIVLTIAIVMLGRYVGAEESGEQSGDENDKPHEAGASGGGFDYKQPQAWNTLFPGCSGQKQSPINIELNDVNMMKPTKSPLVMKKYDAKPSKMTIKNNGHSVSLIGVYAPADVPNVSGGPLTGIYQLNHVHFHWGGSNTVGSEHTVGNKSFPMEMHMVHTKTGYKDLDAAVKHPDGVAVIGYLLSLDKKLNMGFEKIMAGIPKILKPKQFTDIEAFPLASLGLDLTKEGYVTYQGSLTTPPCSEAVTWIISARVRDITVEELNAFRKIELEHHDTVNFRPVQALNKRPVLYNL